MNRETKTQNEALLAVGSRPDVLCWRQQVGVFRAYDDPNRLIKCGTAGQSDIGMIVAVTITPEMVGKTIGIAVQPEMKTKKPGSKQRARQVDWQAAVEKRGGIYAVVRSPEEMVELVEKVKSGILLQTVTK